VEEEKSREKDRGGNTVEENVEDDRDKEGENREYF
jgi:hypothetical protein